MHESKKISRTLHWLFVLKNISINHITVIKRQLIKTDSVYENIQQSI